jgi:hypothetical protein
MHRSAVCLLAFLLVYVLVGCKQDQVAHNSAISSKESSEQAKFKDRLKNMTPEERAAELRNNPRARALLMPGGLGNPGDRIGR